MPRGISQELWRVRRTQDIVMRALATLTIPDNIGHV